MQTLLVIALLLGGAVCEVYGLVTIARDVKNAAAATQAIANEANTVMAANRAVVVDWITRATVGTIGDLNRRLERPRLQESVPAEE